MRAQKPLRRLLDVARRARWPALVAALHALFSPPAAGAPQIEKSPLFEGRTGKRKEEAVKKAGGKVVDAITHGLAWLASHQHADGRWDPAAFMKREPEAKPCPCDRPGKEGHTVGVTGLALLAFLGDGNTLRAGVHRDNVVKATAWLKEQQREDGLFGTDSVSGFAYDHAIATLAMIEAYGLSNYKLLRDPAQRGIQYIQKARNPYKVWRYQPRDGDNDTSVTGWMVLALRSAEEFRLDVDKGAFRYAQAWFDEVTDPASGAAGYSRRGERSSRLEPVRARFPGDQSEAMTAVALLCRFLLGEDPVKSPVMAAAAATMAEKTPPTNPDGSMDMYYWHFGSLAMFQAGGAHWDVWNQQMQAAVLPAQKKEDCSAGSWDPADPWGEEGGRVYSTALMVLCLQAPWRYARK